MGNRLNVDVGPHIFSPRDTSVIMRDVVIALCPAMAASVLIFGFGGIQRKLETADTPEAFKVLPVLLLSAAILGLALMGFAGVFEALPA